ncbi:MAG: SUMF1/EgtB/PvdO family nonheme iron enzyme [Candidatus Tenebribacter davisii]|nr:SUMF1/EgtB/PvdO family nonheme iron enzyme [Candidatus Tenebribacter davisii]
MNAVKVVVCFFVLIGLCSCSNDSTSSNNELPTYEETGIIGDEGGIVHITDEESEIYGTYVEIPEGALNNSVEITIQQIDEFTFVDTTAIVVDFTPSGTQFSELVEIGIPFKENSDLENLQLYTYNEVNEAWEVMLIDHIDAENNLVISKTNHFSLYTAGDYISIMFEANVYKTSDDKIGVHIQAPEFNEIPTRLAYWGDGIYNVEQCIDGDPFENFPKAWFKITVREDTWWSPETFSYKVIYYDRYSQATAFGDWKAEINDNNGNEILQYNEWLDINALSDFYSGLPYIIESESFDTSEDFVIIVEFYYSQYTDLSASSTLLGRYTPIFSFAIEDLDFDDLFDVPTSLDEDEDMITNDYDVPETEPYIEIITPTSTQNGNITINYNLTDEDGDLNEFGVYYQSTGTGQHLATLISSSTGSIHLGGFIQNIEQGSQSFVWDSYSDYPDNAGQFKIVMSWVDPEGGMPGLKFESEYFLVDNSTVLNQPPLPPTNPNPSNNSNGISTNTSLSWECTDPENDPLTYDVYFGTSSNPAIVNTGQSGITYDPGTLEEETTYYWKIIAHDNHSNSTIGDIWTFTTLGPGNQPPNTPSNPNPTDNAIEISINTNLSWECTDPENDPLTYDVYFGTSSNPYIVSNGQSSTIYVPGTLEYDTTYYWKIVAHDNHNNSTTGSIWQFTTAGTVNQPPNPPSNPNPSNNATSVTLDTNLSWDCTDPENDPLTYDVYFGISSNPSIISNGQNNTTYDPETLEYDTTYYWKIVVHDDHNNSTTGSVWQFDTINVIAPVEMIFVQGGTFDMGDYFGEGDADELPIHSVTLSNFYIGKYEITHTEFISFLNDFGATYGYWGAMYNNITLLDMVGYEDAVGYNNGLFYFEGSPFAISEDCPVICATWRGAKLFCNWLSQVEGFTPCYDLNTWECNFNSDGYRLPTEAEWEYAARGGVSWTDEYRYSGCNDLNDLPDYAWYYSNSNDQTHPVGTKQPNQLGIYNMNGNVWEMCNDWYASDYYSNSPSVNPYGPDDGNNFSARGGTALFNPDYCRVANRNDQNNIGYHWSGFRVVRCP